VNILVPPLRERVQDILPLVEYFLGQFNLKFNKSFTGISVDARQALVEYRWPGNIREIKNMVERSVLLGSGQLLEREHFHFQTSLSKGGDLPELLRGLLRNPLPAAGVDLEGLVNEFEELLVRKAFNTAGGNQTEAARLLGLNRDKFRYRLKQYGIKEK
jgi:DNA-binding NtrC family response regulator